MDDAFSLVHRNPTSHKSAREVAEEVWPTMARSMQKYLRTTRLLIIDFEPPQFRLFSIFVFRQHQHFKQEDVLDHLSFCFRHSMSGAAFLARYLLRIKINSTLQKHLIFYDILKLLLVKDDIISIAIIYFIFNPFENPRPAMTYPGHLLDSAAWSMSCDEPLLSSIRHGITFQGPGQNFSFVITSK